jgi:hypothetical protein
MGNRAFARKAAASILALLVGIGSSGIAEARERAGDVKSKRYAATQPAPKRVIGQERLKRVYLGSAPWICSPSGFGRRASCFLRASAD